MKCWLMHFCPSLTALQQDTVYSYGVPFQSLMLFHSAVTISWLCDKSCCETNCEEVGEPLKKHFLTTIFTLLPLTDEVTIHLIRRKLFYSNAVLLLGTNYGCKNKYEHTLTWVCIFSIMCSLHFLRCWQGEFVYKSTASLVGDHFR